MKETADECGTQLARSGASSGGPPKKAIMDQIGHRDFATLKRYERMPGLLDDNAPFSPGL